MRTLIAALAVSGAVATPALAQDEAQGGGEDAAGLLAALTCSQFLQLGAQDQMTVMLAMRAHLNGDDLPDEPLPIGLDAEVGSPDGPGGDSGASGDAGAEGLETDEATVAEAAEAAATVAEEGTEGGGEGADGADPPDETGIVDGENESGQVSADGTEASVTDAPADPRLTGMRTSCEGGPEALASDAMLAAHADYE